MLPEKGLTYHIRREERSGLFGIRRRQESVGWLFEGDTIFSNIGGNNVTLELGSESRALSIKTGDKPVVVEFKSEPQRFLPKFVVRLDRDHPEATTTRRQVTVYLAGDSSKRITLKAPRFEPLIMTPLEVVAFVVNQMRREQKEAQAKRDTGEVIGC